MSEEKFHRNDFTRRRRISNYDDEPEMSFSELWKTLVVHVGYIKAILCFVCILFMSLYWMAEDCFGQISQYCRKLLTKNNAKNKRRL